MSEILAATKIHRSSLALIYIGFGSILSQILLIREFLVSFYGNELSIGIILACWLVWVGIGSAAGNKIIHRIHSISHLFFILIALTPLVMFMQFLAVKFVRGLLHTTAGEFLSMMELLGFSCSVLSVGCFLWGVLFTLGAKLLSSEREELWLGVNKAYVLESAGSVVGGLLFSFVLTSVFSTLQTIVFLTLSAWSMVLWHSFIGMKRFRLVALLSLIVLYYFLLPQIRMVEHQMDAYQWSLVNDKLTFVRSIDTKHQNLSLLRLENQYTIYSDGRPAYNIPNTYDAEVFIHSILIHRFDAKRVLIFGGGFNGILKELLKYPVQEIEYVENDPALLPFVEPILDKQNLQAFQDSRVKIVSGDGREFLTRKQRSFDVIILNIGEPATANLNRFFTVEFYRLCSTRLASNGILAFSFPSSAEYISDELKNLNASIYHTFKQVFQNILVIPGDHAILIGSQSKRPFVQDPDSLAQLYTTAKITTEYFSKYMFEEKMPPERIKYITNTLESVQDYRINTDTHPVKYYFDLLLWNRFLDGDNKIISIITRTGIFVVGTLSAGILCIIILLRRRQKEKQERNALAVIMACGGMIGMALNLLLILNFQETFGSIYELLGALSAVSMLGLALGAILIARITQKYKMKFILLGVLMVLLIVVLLLPQLLYFLVRMHSMPVTFFTTMFCSGVIGMLFGIVNRLYYHRTSTLGSIYSYDVLGSSLGALIASSVLLPVLGIQEMAIFLMLVLVPAIIAATIRLKSL